MDIRVAYPGSGDAVSAGRTIKFASLTDCEAEPSGIYVDRNGTTLFVNGLHRGGRDRRDLGVMIQRER